MSCLWKINPGKTWNCSRSKLTLQTVADFFQSLLSLGELLLETLQLILLPLNLRFTVVNSAIGFSSRMLILIDETLMGAI